MKGYDKIAENANMLLDLPFYEGTGAITRDQAKPHHQDVLLANTPTWDSIGASGLGILTFDGLAEYLYLDNAASVDLDFVAGDYSIGGWFNWTDNSLAQILLARYELDVSGWEQYLYGAGGINYLNTRHHHAATLVPRIYRKTRVLCSSPFCCGNPRRIRGLKREVRTRQEILADGENLAVIGNPRSGCYSVGWTPGVWWFMGISRTGGGEAIHYRNGIELAMVTGGLVDPETNNHDLVIGVRYSKNANYYKGSLWRPRIWNRALSAAEWLNIFNIERDWFGV